ncbi:MAG: Na+/H+ antiporter subunit E [Propionibacteriaceae bacterium]|nr:Na+/H+ antiporter subunit E [Propionibacteriaceae bacterium]
MRWCDLMLRVVGLGLAWLVISEGRLDYLLYGALSVALATVVSVSVAPLRPLRLPSGRQLLAALGLAAWLLGRMVVGGVDVARRAVGPRRWVDPVEEDLPAPGDGVGTFAAALAGLMPGTLVYRIGTDDVGMHALAPELDAASGWATLLERVRRVTRGGRPSPGPTAAG